MSLCEGKTEERVKLRGKKTDIPSVTILTTMNLLIYELQQTARPVKNTCQITQQVKPFF